MAPIESGAMTATHVRGTDAAQLHAERVGARPARPAWVYALIFLAVVGVTVAVVLAVM